ncbi:helix-hairpin-helix domain-containing protein [Kangiella sp.]|uniref:helix-hairpin-helix domain-containing protein n=1 Tax=Kangiella sp. TaxID=1920245 RepID=UPI0019A3B432|nr:helix-hairpin-helix domain-containing protein [Kangiella sp.]MBD3654673.1 helix-hairpin-helix domain-containing protein [Kangiella sp.]
MPSVDLEDMVHLVHGELTTALASTSTYYDAPMVEISSIKVRMGQFPSSQEQTNLQLDTERYPLAQDGWQLEVTYDAKKKSNQKALEQLTQSGTPSIIAYDYLSKLPIRYLNSSDTKLIQALAKSGIESLADLVELPAQQLLQVKGVPAATLRSTQAAARLALTDPNLFIPDDILEQSLGKFLDGFRLLSEQDYSYYDWNTLEVIYEWLQQLELCLSPQLIRVLTFEKLLEE